MLDEPIGDIAPELHGHFTEHIGEVVYDGIWVGENSKIPNVGGIRKALVDHMRQLHAPVIRWPGGCFADSYNWRDGVGPRTQRPVRTNFWDNDPSTVQGPRRPAEIRPQHFWHGGIHALLPTLRRPALRGRQRPQPDSARFRRMGGVLQLARGQHHAGPNPRRRRQPRTLTT